jgi:hypothetical protein
VFTKYDTSVTSAVDDAGDDILELEDDEIWAFGEKEADKCFEQALRESSMASLIDRVPIVKVSSQYLVYLASPSILILDIAQERYKATIAKLIEDTDKEIQKYFDVSSHTEPISLAWAVAQRSNVDINIEASIEWVAICCHDIKSNILSAALAGNVCSIPLFGTHSG